MSNKTDLQALNSNYAVLIETLRDKSIGSGSVETCTVTIEGATSSYYPVNIAYTTVSSDGKVVGASQTCSTSSATVTCVKGTMVTVLYKSSINIATSHSNASLLFSTAAMGVYKLTDEADTAYIHNSTSSSGGSNN